MHDQHYRELLERLCRELDEAEDEVINRAMTPQDLAYIVALGEAIHKVHKAAETAHCLDKHDMYDKSDEAESYNGNGNGKDKMHDPRSMMEKNRMPNPVVTKQ